MLGRRCVSSQIDILLWCISFGSSQFLHYVYELHRFLYNLWCINYYTIIWKHGWFAYCFSNGTRQSHFLLVWSSLAMRDPKEAFSPLPEGSCQPCISCETVAGIRWSCRVFTVRAVYICSQILNLLTPCRPSNPCTSCSIYWNEKS